MRSYDPDPPLLEGGRFGGWSIYIKDGILMYCHNWLDTERYYVAAEQPLPADKSIVQYTHATRFTPHGET